MSSSTGGRLVYAIGDIHGRYDLLKLLLGRIAADATDRARRPTLILLGDYIDRGPHSAEVLTAIGWLRRESGFTLHLLKGNHEQMMLDAIDDPERLSRWIAAGGDAALRSYGIDDVDSDGSNDPLPLRDRLLDAMPAAHLMLLQSLELSVVIGDYVLVHAGIRPDVGIGRQTADDLLWIRSPFLDGASPLEKRVVHGHSWTDARPHVDARRIGIDTGAWHTGVLTAVRLDGEDVRFLTAEGDAGPD